MSVIHVNHIAANCRSRFENLIDMTDTNGLPHEDAEKLFLTRSLSAFAIAALARVDDQTAASAVVDEKGDDGIDAFYFDRAEHVCYLAQSKWSKNGTATVDVGSILKFTQGINHFLECRTEELGPKMKARKKEIEEVLADAGATFVLAVVYTGQGSLSPEAIKPLQNLVDQLNDGEPCVSIRPLNQGELHRVVTEMSLGKPVDLTVLLHEWGKTSEPYKAYYGSVAVSDIAPWGKFGDHLYNKNIRSFKGNTEVNDAIAETLETNPENFIYLNNGITLLCGRIDKQPLGGASRTSAVFECKDTSVVNGAQTVGSIVAAHTLPDNAHVMVRLISLEKCPADFASDVTRATNTQNRIERRDFAALDKEQPRLRSEMLLSLRKEYAYRTGDPPPKPEAGCTLDEAAVALACAHQDASYSTVAKREVSKLYEDLQNAPYRALFNDSLTATALWRAVLVHRAVDAHLREAQKTFDGRERLICVHGNRLLLHVVFEKLGDTWRNCDDEEFAAKEKEIPAAAETLRARITKYVTENYPTAYPANIFKNITRCKEIAAAMKDGAK